MDDLARREHDLEAEDVVGRHPVLEAVRPSRVLGHVAAECARSLRRRVGRIVIAARGDRLREPDVDHAGLDDGAVVGVVDLEDAVHARQLDGHRALARLAPYGDRARAEPRPRPPRPEGDAVPREQADHARDLLGGPREDDGQRPRPVGRHGIALVNQELGIVGDHAVGAENLAQPGDERRGKSGWHDQ